MKQLSLFIALLIFSSVAFSQACPIITRADIITLGPNSYRLEIDYTASGQKHIVDSIFCGSTFISTVCIDVQGNGSYSEEFTCSGGTPSVVLIPGTGTCINGTTCGERIFVCPSCGPLPVTLSDFEAQRQSNDVFLTWKTEAKVNFSHFEILKSTDNNNFEVIGTVSSKSAFSNFVENYSFTDVNNFINSESFYKLRIVDIDGKIAFSPIKAVRGINGKPQISVYPNPARSNSKVTVSGIIEPSNVRIMDHSGRVLKTVQLGANGAVELSGIQRGNYIMVITGKNTGQSEVKKITVVQ